MPQSYFYKEIHKNNHNLREKKREADWRGEEERSRGGRKKNPSSHGRSGSVQSCGSFFFFCAPLMTSETSCFDVTVMMDSSFPPTGRVGELWEVWSSLVVQTVHPVLVNYRRMWIHDQIYYHYNFTFPYRHKRQHSSSSDFIILKCNQT